MKEGQMLPSRQIRADKPPFIFWEETICKSTLEGKRANEKAISKITGPPNTGILSLISKCP